MEHCKDTCYTGCCRWCSPEFNVGIIWSGRYLSSSMGCYIWLYSSIISWSTATWVYQVSIGIKISGCYNIFSLFCKMLDDQCALDFGRDFRRCKLLNTADPCGQLWCASIHNPTFCKTKNGAPLDGTSCGPSKQLALLLKNNHQILTKIITIFKNFPMLRRLLCLL